MGANHLRIKLLGELRVLHDGVPVDLPQSRKARALLAWLAVSGKPHTREQLCNLLWDVADDPRGALRWCLSKLRPALDGDGHARVVADRTSVRLETTELDLDLSDLEHAWKNATAMDPLQLEAVLEQTQGEFLEGVELPDHHEFHAWCLAQRQRARRMRAGTLRALLDKLEHDPERALQHARILARLEPQVEDSQARVVRLLVRLGRARDAEEHYAAAQHTLKRLQVEPVGLLTTAIREAQSGGPHDAPPAQRIGFCRASDGVQLAYATIGRGPLLVKTSNWLTHLEYDWYSPLWRHLARDLSKDFTLLRHDQRGNGLSDWNVPTFAFDRFVEDFATVMDAVGAERVPILGISQGCAVAVAYAARHPERVSKLVLYGGYARGWRKRATPAKLQAAEAMLNLMRYGWGQENPAFRQLFTSLFMPGATPEQADWFNKLQRVSCSPENAVAIRTISGDTDVTELLGRVQAPTLVLHAAGDETVPFEEGRRLAGGIAGARFVPLESRNHLLLEDEPAWSKFMLEVRRFLLTN
ncbi:MAG: alpha/beta fold hydrolase [Planctomycetes bacterium]|nr:alpha/beta fold hydrolase [Planctomycetota bacterium]MCB9936118.1 alpha/beta fold hydrolase [Planctomycetota bacterium]